MRTFDLAQNDSKFVADELAKSHIRNESVLESVLHANPQALLEEPVFIFGRQPAVDTGILDLLALDQYGNLVIFELKVGQSGSGSASEETILSQPQNYAQALESYTYDRLDDIYQDYREDIESGRWAVSDSAVPAHDLDSAFEAVFGEALEPDEFNPDQRMVIVAEQITSQTRRNARYLLEQGLDMQCVEIQKFDSGITDHAVLATNTVVDYDLSRVRPERKSNPTYPDVVTEFIERVSPRLRSVVETDSPEIVFQDVEGYRPYFRSQRPEHPQNLRYTLYLRPIEWEFVAVAMDYWGENEDTLETLRRNADLFEDEGFTVKRESSRDRIVSAKWETDSANVLSDDAFLEDVADEFVNLVRTGHHVFTEGE